jgi:hypothetical protein
LGETAQVDIVRRRRAGKFEGDSLISMSENGERSDRAGG